MRLPSATGDRSGPSGRAAAHRLPLRRLMSGEFRMKPASMSLLAFCVFLAGSTLPASTVTFHTDDPLTREPETQDASGVSEWTIDLFIDLAVNLFGEPGDSAAGVRARNVNTIDEVPDSSWFTNRILARHVSIDEAVKGPISGAGPAPGIWTIVGAKDVGMAPGFTIEDANRETWFISFDARGYPEAATGAILVANKIFWTLGYWQVENVLARVERDNVVIGDTAMVTPMSGDRRRMTRDDLEDVWLRAHQSADGSYRAVAARRLAGKPLGGFRYHGTRPDDPNDVVDHEHRRELRALRAFGAWTNLVDMKAGNTLDMLVTENGRKVVRHYLQDVGSTFGTGATGPREFDEGWEHLYEGDLVWKRLVSLGFLIRPWHTVRYTESQAVGRFEGAEFDPLTWKPRVPTAAFRHAQPDDLFWAARRVMAFSDDMIRALANTGMYSDPESARHIADVLIQRRDKIGASYLIAVNPLVDFELSDDGRLSFANAAVAARVAQEPKGGYRASWARFDNATAALTPLGDSIVTREWQTTAPPLPAERGSFVSVRIAPIDPPSESWTPIRVFFRRDTTAWTLVGVERKAA
jgi:hypothetical protein